MKGERPPIAPGQNTEFRCPYCGTDHSAHGRQFRNARTLLAQSVRCAYRWRGTAMDAEATPPATHANRPARASAGGLNIEDLGAALVRSQASYPLPPPS